MHVGNAARDEPPLFFPRFPVRYTIQPLLSTSHPQLQVSAQFIGPLRSVRCGQVTQNTVQGCRKVGSPSRRRSSCSRETQANSRQWQPAPYGRSGFVFVEAPRADESQGAIRPAVLSCRFRHNSKLIRGCDWTHLSTFPLGDVIPGDGVSSRAPPSKNSGPEGHVCSVCTICTALGPLSIIAETSIEVTSSPPTRLRPLHMLHRHQPSFGKGRRPLHITLVTPVRHQIQHRLCFALDFDFNGAPGIT